MKEPVINRIKASGLNLDFIIKNALEITKSYAGSANADPKAIPQVYKDVIVGMMDLFDGIEAPKKQS